MKKLMIALMAALALVLTFATGAFAQARTAAQPAHAAQAAHVYLVALSPMNDSGVSGFVVLVRRGDQLTVSLHARGLELGQMHMQHIHGVAGQAVCPPPSAD